MEPANNRFLVPQLRVECMYFYFMAVVKMRTRTKRTTDVFRGSPQITIDFFERNFIFEHRIPQLHSFVDTIDDRRKKKKRPRTRTHLLDMDGNTVVSNQLFEHMQCGIGGYNTTQSWKEFFGELIL